MSNATEIEAKKLNRFPYMVNLVPKYSFSMGKVAKPTMVNVVRKAAIMATIPMSDPQSTLTASLAPPMTILINPGGMSARNKLTKASTPDDLNGRTDKQPLCNFEGFLCLFTTLNQIPEKDPCGN